MQGLVHIVENLLVCKKKLKSRDQIEQNEVVLEQVQL